MSKYWLCRVIVMAVLVPFAGIAHAGTKLGNANVIELPIVSKVMTNIDGSRQAVPDQTSAVSLNITAVKPSGSGYITVYPCGVKRPLASNLNFVKGDIVANGVIAPIGYNGKVCLFSSVNTDLVVDANGYFSASDFVAATPQRLVDSRKGTGMAVGKLDPSRILSIPIAGLKSTTTSGMSTTIPADAKAAALNVTVVNPVGGGYVTVYPCDSKRPLSSNLNYSKGQVVANGVIAPLSAKGSVCVYSSNRTDIVVDLEGWFVGSDFHGVTPERLVDTRNGTGGDTGKLRGGKFLSVPIRGQTASVAGSQQIIPSEASAAILNVTAVKPAGGGYFTVYPCSDPRPLASNLNYVTGGIVANNVVAPISSLGDLCVFSSSTSDVVVDLAGWLSSGTGSGFTTTQPERLVDTRVGTGPAPGPAQTQVLPTVSGKSETVSTAAGTPVTIDLPTGGLTGTSLNYRVIQQPLHGKLTGTGSSRIYTGNSNFSGTDSFLVYVSNGSGSGVTRRVNVSLTPAQVTLKASVFGDGTITPKSGAQMTCNGAICTLTRDENTNVTLTATPNPGWKFQHWGGCDSVTSSGGCQVLLDHHKVVYPTFVSTTPPQISSNVIPLTQTDLDSLVNYDPGANELYFDGNYDVSKFSVGKILLAYGQYSGKTIYFARRITHIGNVVQGTREIDTQFASLDQIITSGTLSVSRQLTAADLNPKQLPQGFTINYRRALLNPLVIQLAVKKTIQPGGTGPSIGLNGQLDLEAAPDFAFQRGGFFGFGVKEFRFVMDTKLTPSIDITVSGSTDLLKQKYALGKPIIFDPILVPLPIPVPIVLVPEIQLYVELNAKFGAQLSAKVSYTEDTKLGVEYLKGVGVRGIAEHTESATFDPTASETFSAKLGLPAEASLMVEGTAGPTVSLGPYVKGVATLAVPSDSQCPLDIAAYLGLEASAGGELELLSHTIWSVNVPLLDLSHQFYDLRCSGTKDTEPPSVPALNSVAYSPSSGVNIAWTASTDNRQVSGYQLYKNMKIIASRIAGTSYVDQDVTPGQQYCYYLSAMDAAGNTSQFSDTKCVTVASEQANSSPPSIPADVAVTSAMENSLTLHWSPSTATGTVKAYTVMSVNADGSQTAVATSAGTTTTIGNLQPGTKYCFAVLAVDDQGNTSTASSQACGTTASQSSGSTSPDVTSGLIAYYPLDGNANDASGNGHNGVLEGNTGFAPGKIGEGATFDGDSDYILFNQPLIGDLTQWTLAAWVKTTENNTRHSIYGEYTNAQVTGGDTKNYIVIDDITSTSQGLVYDNNPPSGGGVISGQTIPQNAWHHVTIVRNGSVVQLYIDGQLVKSGSYTAYAGGAATFSALGARLNSSTSVYCCGNTTKYSMHGMLDDVRIYNRALDSSAIQKLASGSVQQSNMAYYNGRYYQFLQASLTWSQAKAAAATHTYDGIKGHLVTITSADENKVVYDLVKDKAAAVFICASDAQNEGVWRWECGPEKGQQFWQGAGSGHTVNGMYADWGQNHPSGSTGQNWASMNTISTYSGKWSDGRDDSTELRSYVVEYDP